MLNKLYSHVNLSTRQHIYLCSKLHGEVLSLLPDTCSTNALDLNNELFQVFYAKYILALTTQIILYKLFCHFVMALCNITKYLHVCLKFRSIF